MRCCTKMDCPNRMRGAIKLLNNRLCDIIDLQLQAKQRIGRSGAALYWLGQAVRRDLEAAFEWTDLIAERAVILGGQVEAMCRRSRANLAAIPPRFTCEPCGSLPRPCGAGEHIRKGSKKPAGDADTADMFTEISRAIDKFRWFVEAHQADR